MRAGSESALGTTNPRLMGKTEIDALAMWMKSSGFGLSYQSKLWQYLGGLLAYCGNGILEQLKAKGQWRPPKRVHRPVYVKDDAWFQETLRKLETRSDWRATVVLAGTAIFYHTGLRPKELRLVSTKDLNRTDWSITVQHPKGESAWAAEGEKVRIFPSLRPYVADYLDVRARHLREIGLDPDAVEPLFPNENGQHYTANGWRTARWKVFRELGIDGNYRVLRASFGQKLKDAGAPIEAVSKALRHTTVATTEKFYARIRSNRAWDALERAWETPQVDVVH